MPRLCGLQISESELSDFSSLAFSGVSAAHSRLGWWVAAPNSLLCHLEVHMNKSGIYRYRLRPRVFVVLTGRQLLLIPDGPSFTQECRNCL